MSLFSKSKGESDTTSLNKPDGEVSLDETPASGKSSPEIDSAIGPDILIKGNIVCPGTIKIFGHVIGDIHTSHLVICKGAQIEGNVTAQEIVIDSVCKGSIHGNSVKLQSAAVVDGEISSKSLIIELNAQFVGMSRRLEKLVEPPSSHLVKGEKLASVSTAEPVQSIGQNEQFADVPHKSEYSAEMSSSPLVKGERLASDSTAEPVQTVGQNEQFADVTRKSEYSADTSSSAQATVERTDSDSTLLN